MMRVGKTIIRVVRTRPLESGYRSVWYLPDGTSVHAIEDKPIELGTYFLTPDDTGRFRNWVIERELGTRVAVPWRGNDCLTRTNVEVHIGNTLADTSGCVCPGLATYTSGVRDSGVAIKHLRNVLERDTSVPPVWILEIIQ